jgi:hypothetical protein
MSDPQELEQKLALLEQHVQKINESAKSFVDEGWNAALDMVAFRLIHDHKQAFGPDTLASVAAYIKGFKK